MEDEQHNQLNKLYQDELSHFEDKIIVLDDDPTGTQTVNGVYVYTDWKKETIRMAFEDSNSIVYILTNSRSFSEAKTKQVHQEIAGNIALVAKELDKSFLIISRGDSTLRGHYPLETATLRESLEERNLEKIDGEILCPFFYEGGRFTSNNIHYLRQGTQLVPVAQTEFAKDPTFEFHSSNLIDYIIEKSKGDVKAEDCLSIPLEALQQADVNKVVETLTNCHDFQKIVVNATNYGELKVFAIAFMRAIKLGKKFIVRSAASLPKVLGGITDKKYLTSQDVVNNNQNGGLVIVGSHVDLTNRQLTCVKESSLALSFLEFNVNAYFLENSFANEISLNLQRAENEMEKGKTVVISTSRKVEFPPNTSKEEKLEIAVRISNALTEIVSHLSIKPKYVIAKGGITSSDVATKGLRITKGYVLGQIDAGIPVWLTDNESKFPNMPYLVFPGNVGSEQTLKEIIEELEKS
ncbi:hypothetical protein BAU15_01815 [Enterococcus sp. JM4C]|uniref:four-carbon acid sugar kinase family protein n=1 Tax=Candidatus Enterococcus huntleyi TaxID=1857217 RepID=UPI00137B3E72|nr:four-carbon acid sugar kinase family protein [Enterococcus sp. JM4C]KAF1299407.1 hypothetical protein BAU15_01815 [Enterococcus sp. JM4C]